MRGYGDAIVSRFPIVGTTHLTMNWGGKDRWWERRMCIQATLAVGAGHINVFTTHPSKIDVAVQAPQMVEFMRMFAEPRILTGDFNLYEDNPWFAETHEVFTAQGYDDAWMAAGTGDRATFPAGTIDPAKRIHRIDYIFHSRTPGLVIERAVVDTGEVASDHCPLFADYVWDPSAQTAAPASSNADGSLLREQWDGVQSLGDLRAVIAAGRPATQRQRLLLAQAPWRIGGRYGSRLCGWIIAPLAGGYTVWIAGDGRCELHFGSDRADALAQPPIARVAPGTALYTTKEGGPVSDGGHTGSAQWGKYASQRSGIIHLRAGERRWIEALHVTSNGREELTIGDNLAIGWQLPDGTHERPIPSARLSPPDDAAAVPLWDPTIILDAGGDRSVIGAAVLAASGRSASGAALCGRVAWTQVEGPGSACFWDASALSTLVTFSQPGLYVLRLAIENHALSAFTHVRLQVASPLAAAPIEHGLA
ncbi:MAG: endonuclease/exonuclease/phosphatase family protein [Planctomycetes bacterium]|nr:endonuclease/exonuclease/phosphatase family protein [Planctomycetota bacterium]